jgi:hypothetical protein
MLKLVRMKAAIYIFFLLSFLSCRHPKYPMAKLDDLIVGNWNVCSIKYSHSAINFNVCPMIVFKKGSLGYIKRSNPVLLYFKWKTNENKLFIEHQNKSQDDIVNDGIYKVIVRNNKTFQEVDLVDTASNVTYVLGGIPTQ